MAIGLSHGGTNVYSSTEPSHQLWAGTQDGLVLFEREKSGKWREAQRALRGQHISSIIFERTTGAIFAGAFFGSVHASVDGGKTWERRDNGIPIHDVYSLAANVVDGKVRVYAGTQPAHLFVSEDLGLHWNEIPSLRAVPTVSQWSFPAPPHVAHTKFITFDPHDSKTIYACIEQGAFLKSSDDGKSWRELNTVGLYKDKNRPVEHFYDVHRCLIDPRDPNSIFVTGGAGVYVTKTGGAAAGSAGPARNGPPMSIPMALRGIQKIPSSCSSRPPNTIPPLGAKPVRRRAPREKFTAVTTAAKTGKGSAVDFRKV